MSTKLGVILADFTTNLATGLVIGGTSATLQSATDDDSIALVAGRYFFTLDGANSSKEHISCDLSGTALTNIKSISRQGVESVGVVRAHRIGCTVSLTDFAHIKFMNDLLAGGTTFNASVPLGYDGTASITTPNQLATKAYVDGIAIAGSPDSTTTVKGIGKVSVAPVSPTSPIFVGDNDPRVSTQNENDAQVGNDVSIAVGTSNKFVTQTGFQKGTEVYAADSVGTDSYAITLSPVPTAYTAGMVIRFKAGTANTGAATLNVNSLGAKTIKKNYNSDIVTGDIVANQICTVVYDGTNLQLQSPVPQVVPFTWASGSKVLAASASNQISSNGATPQLLAEITMSSYGLSGGIISTTFDLQNATANGGTVHGRIYVNDIAVGTDRTTTANSYSTFTEDISVNPGDKVQVYASGTAGNVNTAQIRSFKVKASSLEVTSVSI